MIQLKTFAACAIPSIPTVPQFIILPAVYLRPRVTLTWFNVLRDLLPTSQVLANLAPTDSLHEALNPLEDVAAATAFH